MLLRVLLSKRGLIAWLVLALGAVASTAAAVAVRNQVQERAVDDVAVDTDAAASAIEQRLRGDLVVLRSAIGLVEASEELDRPEWRRFVAVLDLPSTAQGTTAIAYVPLVRADALATHVRDARLSGLPAYDVAPSGTRPFYAPQLYVEPFRGANTTEVGRDLLADPVFGPALTAAQETGEPVLVTTAGSNRAAVVVPVYAQGLPLVTPDQRRSALVAWVAGHYDLQAFVDGTLDLWVAQHGERLGLFVRDDASPPAVRAASAPDLELAPDSPSVQVRSIEVADRTWQVVVDRRVGIELADDWATWIVLAGGLVITVLLAALVLALIEDRLRARRMAHDLTAEVRAGENSLRESEQRWQFAVEGTGDGLWDWNMVDDTVWYSTRWKAMLGYADDEIGDGLSEWASRLHPDDEEFTNALIADHLSGRSDHYESEHRVRCKDGSYIWVLDRGLVVERAEDGTPTRMIGTHKEITERKELESTLRARTAELEEAQRIAGIGRWRMSGPDDRLVWSSALFDIFGLDPAREPPTLAELEDLFVPADWARITASVAEAVAGSGSFEIESEVHRGDGDDRWVRIRGEALITDGGIVGVQGIVMDITQETLASQHIDRLSRMYRALSDTSAAVVRCISEQDLFDTVCHVVVGHGGLDMAWVGVVDWGTGAIVPRSSAGRGTDYLDHIDVSIRTDRPEGHGPAGTAVREDTVVWIDDFSDDPRAAPWRDRSRLQGWQSCASVPLHRGGVPVAVLSVYSTRAGWLDADIRGLLEEIGHEASVALDKLEAQREVERARDTLAESEERFRSLVEQSIAGTFIVQDGRLAYANPRLASILGYDSPRHLEGAILIDLVAPEDRGDFVDQQQALHAGLTDRVSSTLRMIRRDGSPVDIGANASLARYGDGVAMIGMIQDVSDQQVAEDSIRRYADRLEHTFIQTVGLVTTMSEMRDPYTAGHEKRVAELSVAIGIEMGLDEDRVEGLRVGGHLHDVGKMSVPAEILVKPSRLTSLEFDLIKQHAQAGYDVLVGVDFPWPVAEVALQHHERIDGSGYPRGLRSDEIILEARIVAVADVVESMSSHRPYRPALGVEAALEEIERGRGALYDPEVVDACVRVLRPQDLRVG